MKINNNLTDEAVLGEIAERLQERRFDAKLSQADLANKAGVGKRTVERLESGESTQLSNLLRILRALELLVPFDAAIPEPGISPMDLLKLQKKSRQRVSRNHAVHQPEEKWQWGDDK